MRGIVAFAFLLGALDVEGTVSSSGATYDAQTDTTVFQYSASSSVADQIVLEYPACAQVSVAAVNPVRSGSTTSIEYHAAADKTGLAYPYFSEFSVTVAGHVASSTIGYSLVAGPNVLSTGTVLGPACQVLATTTCDAGGPYRGTCNSKGSVRIALTGTGSSHFTSASWSTSETDAQFSNPETVSPTLVLPSQCDGDVSLTLSLVGVDGVSYSCTASVSLEDVTPPEFVTTFANLDDATAECGDVPTASILTATDDCSSAVSVVYSEESEDISEAHLRYKLVRTWTTSDTCGNAASVTQNILVEDTTPPAIINVDKDLTVECDGVPAPCVPTAVDDCDLSLSSAILDEQTFVANCAHDLTVVRSYSATDAAGNSATLVQTVTVHDTTAPVLSGVPADVEVECDSVPPAAAVSAADNCDVVAPSVSFAETTKPGSNGCTLLKRTWSATDACGQSTSATQTVTVCDTVAPVLSGIDGDVTVECDSVPPECPAEVEDNCDTVLIDLNIASTPGTCDQESSIVYTWSASDKSGNAATGTQTVTIVDTLPPKFGGGVVPPSLTVDCGNVPDFNVSGDDECAGVVEVSKTEQRIDGPNAAEYTLSRSWTTQDPCGNANTLNQIVSVVDDTPPVISSEPVDITVSCENVPEAPVLSVTDNCCDATIAFNEVKVGGSCLHAYLLVRTWTATDCAGNTAVATQTVSVEDNDAPVIENSPGSISVDVSQIPPSASVTSTDPCGEYPPTLTENTLAGTCLDEYSIVRTWTATDNCGNSNSYSQSIDVTDEVEPELHDVPEDTSVSCESVFEPSTFVTASDNSGRVLEVLLESETQAGSCPDAYVVVHTWKATDPCGNSVEDDQTVTVFDHSNPTIEEDFDDTVALECKDIVPDEPSVTASDNCDDEVTVDFDETSTAGRCSEYTITRTWSTTDDCGNSSPNVAQVITVSDTGAPIMDPTPDHETVECDSIPDAPSIHAEDECDGPLDVTFTEGNVPGSQVCTDGYTFTRNWEVTDCVGHRVSKTQTITVEDTTPPVLTAPPVDSITVHCNDPFPEKPEITATDNCKVDSEITVGYSQVPVADDTAYITAKYVRTWTAFDNCGNSGKVTQTIIVKDMNNPSLNVPDSLTISCDEGLPPVPPVMCSDVCSDSDWPATFEETETPGCGSQTTVLRKWTCVDGTGNQASGRQTIQVVDVDAPEFDTLPDGEIDAPCDSVPTYTLTATDDCDDDVTVTHDSEITDQTTLYDYTEVHIWTATDDCGNSAVFAQTIVVSDTEDPKLINLPAHATLSCEDEPESDNVSATDNCDVTISVEYTEETIEGTCTDTSTLLRTWTATDVSGNSVSYTQTISFSDETAPKWTVGTLPGNSQFSYSGRANIPTDLPVSTDNCDPDPQEVCTDVTTPLLCLSYRVDHTCTTTDRCGNTDDHSWTVTVNDDTTFTLSQPLDETIPCEGVGTLVVPTVTSSDTSLTVEYELLSNVDILCEDAYTIRRHWWAVNCRGYRQDVYQNVYVTDVAAPTVTAPADTTAECDSIPSSEATASDLCDHLVQLSPFEETIAGSTTNDYKIVRTWVATDDCANTATAVQTISVTDTTPPTISNVPDDVVEPPVDPNFVPEYEGGVICLDNCSYNCEYQEETEAGSCLYQYKLVRTWSSTDPTGNYVEESQTIEVSDTTPPVLSPQPVDMTVYASDLPNVAVPDVTAVDAVEGELTVTYSQSVVYQPEHIVTRTWSASDSCGNVATHQHIIVVEVCVDCNPCSISSNRTVECDSVPPPEPDTEIVQECVGDNIEVVFEERTEEGSCVGSYKIIRTWTTTNNEYTVVDNSQTITVVDTTGPTWTTTPLPPRTQTVECDDIPDIGPLQGSDNCLVVGQTHLEAQPVITYTYTANPAVYTIHVAYDITDDCGHTNDYNYDIHVIDTTPPTFETEFEHVTSQCDDVSPPVTMVAADNCDPEVDLDPSSQTFPGDCNAEYKAVYTWVATDETGNTATTSQTVTVEDTMSPVFLAPLPLNDNKQCDLPQVEKPEAEDNCASEVDVAYTENPITDGVERIFVAEDDCGNTATHIQTIIVEDTTPPTIGGVDDSSLELYCTDDIPTYDPIPDDNCDYDLEVQETKTPQAGCVGVNGYIYKWDLTDKSGNQAESVIKTIIIVDDVPPTFSYLPSDQYVVVECDEDPPTCHPEAVDDCDESVSVTFTDTPIPAVNPGVVDGYIRTWTAEDDCGNTATYSQTVQFKDTKDPFWATTSSDDVGTCAFVPSPEPPTADDSCTEPTLSMTQATVQGSCDNDYDIITTWVATDSAGNTATTSATVAVGDSVKPTFSDVPANTGIDCQASLPTDDPTAQDCGNSVDVSENAPVTVAGSCEGESEVVRSWLAVDDCGNEQVASQTVVVSDTTPPEFVTFPPDQAVSCDATVTVDPPTASDDCTAVVTITPEKLPDTTTCEGSATSSIRYTASDDCGLSVSDVFTVETYDNTPPVISDDPDDVTVYCLPDDPPTLTATDNCDSAVSVSYSEDDTDAPNIVRTWSSTDDCGNSAFVTQTVTVEDIEPPTLTGLPEGIDVECDETFPTFVVNATDNCDGNDVDVTETKTHTPGVCGSTTLYAWTATDTAGNSITALRVFSQSDTTAPTMTGLPEAETTVECDSIPPKATPGVWDNCADPPLVYTDVVFTETRTDIEFNGLVAIKYDLTRTYSVTDTCGNTVTFTELIHVVDTTPPNLTDGVDRTEECTATPESLFATDNCFSEDPFPATVTDTTEQGTCDQAYSVDYLYTATDLSGNTATQTVHVDVHDTQPPVITYAGDDEETERCDEPHIPPTSTASDCDPNVTPVLDENFDFFDETTKIGDIVRTWTAEDSCGNTASETQTVHVIDITPPTLSGIPEDYTISIDDLPVGDVTVTADDNCYYTTEESEYTEQGSCLYNYYYIRTWTATDGAGNTATGSVTTEIEDKVPPVISLPQLPDAIEVEFPFVEPGVVEYQNVNLLPDPLDGVTATDNSGAPITVTVATTTTGGDSPNEYEIKYTYTAEDDCGNVSTEIRLITVVDKVPCIFNEFPANAEAECDSVGDNDCELYCVISEEDLEKDQPIVFTETIQSLPDLNQEDNYVIIRSWSAVDAAGNTADHSQTITVKDVTAPILSRKPVDETVACDCDSFPQPPSVAALDNCDPEEIIVDFTESRENGSSLDFYVLIRTWTATDRSGNVDTHVQRITVEDTEAPTLRGVPDDAHYSCEDVSSARPAIVQAYDNCDDAATVTSADSAPTSTGSCSATYEMLRTWTATDRSGNTATASRKIIVEDGTAPVKTGGDDQLCLSAGVAFEDFPFTVEDNCSPTPAIENLTCSSTGCSVRSTGKVAIIPQAGETYVATAEVVDDCGNRRTVTTTYFSPAEGDC